MAGLLAILGACGTVASTGPAHRGRPGGIPAEVNAPDPDSNAVPAFYDVSASAVPGPPGTLIRKQRVLGVPGVITKARVWRILYRSRDVTGRVIAVSGYVVAPATQAPSGGYPVIAWDHGTTGMAHPCGPSLFTNLDGQQLYLAPYLNSYLARGYAVVSTDYQGLGTGTLHPYLVGASEAWNTLDAVRAAGQVLRLSPNVVVVGHSQGGQAALFTGQLAATYAPELHLRGVVAIAPATNLTVAVTVASSLSAAGGISHGQGDLDFVAMALWAWAHTYPNLSPSSMFTTLGIRSMQVAGTGCLPQIAAALQHISASHLLRPGASNSAPVRADARLNNPGQVRVPAPMLVIQGTRDQTVPWQLTQLFVDQQACPIGDKVQLELFAGESHSGVIKPAAATVLRWIAARFTGQPARPGCG
ncbi:MAG: alpha/beta fold hydrolase [Acidimicrobiales bacterium]